MSRSAKFLVVLLAAGVFLSSYALDLLAARASTPAGEAAWVKLRVIQQEPGEREEVSLQLPAALVEMLLTAGPEGPAVDIGGREMNLKEFWLRLRETDSGNPLEFRDDGDRFQVWLE